MQAIETVMEACRAKDVACAANELLRKHTTFRIGGPARLFCQPINEEELAWVLGVARDNGLRAFLLGEGSNLIFPDSGFDGMVVKLSGALDTLVVQGTNIRAGAGLPLRTVCEAARDAGLAGLEFAYGIPGSVGGAVYMDAGAFEGEIRQVLESVTCLDDDLQKVTLPVESLQMDYRTSIFHQKPWCILSANFALRAGEREMIDKLMAELMGYRQSKQPLDMPSAGSAFKRPQGAFAGALIDQSGLRGYRVGDAAISEKHCGFIVNLGQATCADVMRLADHVVETVRQKTGYVLEKEIQVVT